MEGFKSRETWKNLVLWEVSLLTAKGWSWVVFNVPSNPNQFVIPWLCCKASKCLLGDFVPLLTSLALSLLLSWLHNKEPWKIHGLSHNNFLTEERSVVKHLVGGYPKHNHLRHQTVTRLSQVYAGLPQLMYLLFLSNTCKILQISKRQKKEQSFVLVIFLQTKNWESGLFSNDP